jgi:SET domain-containing protein
MTAPEITAKLPALLGNIPSQRTNRLAVYSEASYDTWVIHSIRLRLQNNKHGNTLDGLFGTAINPLYSMINHSCSPNVDWRHDDHSSTVTLFAESEIEEGEELFISYIGKALDMGRAERQKRLLPWFGMPCRCKRCEEEISLGEL